MQLRSSRHQPSPSASSFLPVCRPHDSNLHCLQMGKKRLTFRVEPVCRLSKLFEWNLDELDHRVRGLVENTCLYKFARCITPVKLSHHLLGYMCASYDTKDHLFHFEDKTIGISLLDVYHMTGLPITGKAIVEKESIAIRDICAQYIGFNLQGKSIVNLNDLKKTWDGVDYYSVNEDDIPPLVQKHARAYLLYILGCLVFPHSSKLLINASYIVPLMDLNDVNNYAWGAALLAHLHGAMVVTANLLKTNANPQLNGCSILIKMVACYRLKKVAEFYFGNTQLPQDFPLVQRWSSMMVEAKRDCKRFLKPPSIETLSEDGQVMIEDHPYLGVHLPEESADELKICEAYVNLICMKNVWLYNPEVFVNENNVIKYRDEKMRRGMKPNEPETWEELKEFVKIWEVAHSFLRISGKDGRSIDTANDAPEVAEVVVTDGDENGAPDPVNDDFPGLVEQEETAFRIAKLREQNEKLREELELEKENAKLEEELKLYRNKTLPKKVNRKSRASFRDNASSRVRNSSEIRSYDYHLQEEASNAKRQRLSTSDAALERAEQVIIVINSDTDSDDDVSLSDVSMEDSFLEELKKAEKLTKR